MAAIADRPATGRSSAFRRARRSLVFYVLSGFEGQDDLLARLGKHKTSVACLYVNKLADIDQAVLREIAVRTVAWMRSKYPA